MSRVPFPPTNFFVSFPISPSANEVTFAGTPYPTQWETPSPNRPSGSNMKTTKLLVLSGAFDQASAGETFCPPHMRMGSSAAFFLVSMPPSGKDEEETEKAAADALVAPTSNPATRVQKTQFVPLLMARNPSG